MKHKEVIQLLNKNKKVFQSLLSKTGIKFQIWRPAENKWNLHEIVCHLLDEEIFDFKARVKHTLEIPGQPMPSINPAGWVKEKNYAAWNFEETLKKFLTERTESIVYLKTLQGVNWKNEHHHPMLGVITAEQFLVNWLAHDYLHIRQINRYQYLYLKEKSGVDLSYAGEW